MSSDYKFISTTNLLLIHDDKLLILERPMDAKNFPGWLMLPGGKHEPDETPVQTAIRETFEETGIKAVEPSLKIFATHNHFYNNRVYLVYIFTAEQFTGELKMSDEGKPMWMSLKEVLSNDILFPDLKRHINLALEANSNEVIFTYHKFDKDMNIIEES